MAKAKETIGGMVNRGIENSGHLPDLIRLAAPREGHFVLESGHHGDLWLDLDSLFRRPRALAPFVGALAERLAAHRIEVVCGPLVGGALLAQMVAMELGLALWCSEPVARDMGGDLFPVRYGLPPGIRQGIAGERVAIVDDAINAGSAVGGTLAALRLAGSTPVVIGTLLDLDGDRAQPPTFNGLPLVALATMPTRRWTPDACPLCATGIPLERPASD